MASNAVLKIRLDGGTSEPGDGYLDKALIILAGSSTVKGLAIDHFGDQTVEISGAPGNVIEGNFIGTTADGLNPIGDGTSLRSITVGSSNNTIGGTTASARNVISPTLIVTGTQNVVQGNFIGTGEPGTPTLGGGDRGVYLWGSNNTLGGTAPGAGNVISSNGGPGVAIGGDNNSVVSNSISSNGSEGVTVFNEGTGNSLLSNSISSNGKLGINLDPLDTFSDGVTPNDPFDTDTGGNNAQNFPVLNSAVVSNGTTIAGTLGSEADTTYKVQFFSNPSADASSGLRK